MRLKEALHEDRFLLLTQPILPVAGIRDAEELALRAQGWRLHQHDNGEALFEILIRMVNRDGQLVSPSVFVPLAERVGMMPKIDLWVIGRALKFLATLPESTRVGLTINLSNATLQDPDSLMLIDSLIAGSGVPPSKLIFEVTETSEIGSLHSARKFMQGLRRRGVRFALDDFGTGFSSISHLKHLPVDFVKIEGSFITDLSESSRDQHHGRLDGIAGARAGAQSHRRTRRQPAHLALAGQLRRRLCAGTFPRRTRAAGGDRLQGVG